MEITPGEYQEALRENLRKARDHIDAVLNGDVLLDAFLFGTFPSDLTANVSTFGGGSYKALRGISLAFSIHLGKSEPASFIERREHGEN